MNTPADGSFRARSLIHLGPVSAFSCQSSPAELGLASPDLSPSCPNCGVVPLFSLSLSVSPDGQVSAVGDSRRWSCLRPQQANQFFFALHLSLSPSLQPVSPVHVSRSPSIYLLPSRCSQAPPVVRLQASHPPPTLFSKKHSVKQNGMRFLFHGRQRDPGSCVTRTAGLLPASLALNHCPDGLSRRPSIALIHLLQVPMRSRLSSSVTSGRPVTRLKRVSVLLGRHCRRRPRTPPSSRSPLSLPLLLSLLLRWSN